MASDIAELREELVSAIDGVLSRFAGGPSNAPTNDRDLRIEAAEVLEGEWTYRWPQGTETYTAGRWYRISWADRSTRVLVGWCIRKAWGRDRGRVVIFGQFGPATSTMYYPWAEFVEADDGSYVADVPDPKAPRSLLKDGADLPAALDGLTVRRNDECFETVQNGPSLRLVLARDDEEAMIRHAHWVATLRRKLDG